MRSTGISYLFWCLSFVGFCGIHRFYNGKWITGLIWFFTGGLLLIGQLVDLVLIPAMTRRANYKERLACARI
ncbi:MAG: NINE protein [Phycisphaerales bacterium]|nr:NINE protein [Phycisphaerales bacterium]